MPLINRAGGGSALLQALTVAFSPVAQTISPEKGVDGFSTVSVPAANLWDVRDYTYFEVSSDQHTLTIKNVEHMPQHIIIMQGSRTAISVPNDQYAIRMVYTLYYGTEQRRSCLISDKAATLHTDSKQQFKCVHDANAKTLACSVDYGEYENYYFGSEVCYVAVLGY